MLIDENMEAKVFEIKKKNAMEGMTTKSTAFIFTLGFIIHRLYSTCRSPAEANIGLKTIVQSAIGKQVSIQD